MENKKNKKEDAETPILRDFFIQEIFLRLPIKSLLRFKSISKYYYNLISSSRFKKLYLNHNLSRKQHSIILHDYKRLDTCDRDLRHLPHYPSSTVFECNGADGGVENHTDYTFIPHGYQSYSMCSCNGLIFMSTVAFYLDEDDNCTGSKEKLFIVNPGIKEYKKIRNNSDGLSYSLYGLGYDSRNDDYKVVRVKGIESKRDSSEAEVYKLGWDEWKGIGSVSYKFEAHRGVLFNGLLHWVAVGDFEHSEFVYRRKKPLVIVSFDFVSEKFEEVALPEEPLTALGEFKSWDCRANVGELGGCLCVLSHVETVRIDVWVMQEYGVKESWVKSFTISVEMIDKREFNRSFAGDNTPCAKLIRSFKNNNVLLQVNNSLVLYDPKNKSVRQLTIRGAEEWTDAEIYVPNLVSLNSDSSREWERAKRRRPFKYGTSFVWQRPNKRQPAREYKVENFRAKLEEICQG